MRALGGKEEGEMAALFFSSSFPLFSGREANAQGESNPEVVRLSDKTGLGSGRRRRRRRRKGAAGPPRAARPAALPSTRSTQEPHTGMNYYCVHW